MTCHITRDKLPQHTCNADDHPLHTHTLAWGFYKPLFIVCGKSPVCGWLVELAGVNPSIAIAGTQRALYLPWRQRSPGHLSQIFTEDPHASSVPTALPSVLPPPHPDINFPAKLA